MTQINLIYKYFINWHRFINVTLTWHTCVHLLRENKMLKLFLPDRKSAIQWHQQHTPHGRYVQCFAVFSLIAGTTPLSHRMVWLQGNCRKWMPCTCMLSTHVIICDWLLLTLSTWRVCTTFVCKWNCRKWMPCTCMFSTYLIICDWLLLTLSTCVCMTFVCKWHHTPTFPPPCWWYQMEGLEEKGS